jgi:ABC-type Fe3+-hydroxamate transport system substrate-binding protein
LSNLEAVTTVTPKENSMNNKLIKAGAIVVLAGAAVFSLSACSTATSSPESSETTEETGSNVVAPIIVSVEDLDGTTVDVNEGNFIDVNVPADTEGLWTATVADSAILAFAAGGTDGSAIFNPGFEALGVGTTDVTMTDGTTTVMFTVNVSAK